MDKNFTVNRLFNLLISFRSYNDISEVTEPSVPGVPRSTEGAGSNASANAEHASDAENVNATHSDTNTNPTSYQSRVITIHRGNVRRDLIAIFQDPSMMNCHIVVDVLNERGISEKGRGSGVFKDILSLLWKDVYDSPMLGEGERVPSIRHDFQRKEWEAIARILLKGFQEYQYFPLRLSKTFVVSCLFGESAVSEQMLMESFMQYVSQDERKVIQKCSNGELEPDDENLIELLSTFYCKRAVTESTILKTVTELAHQELIQRPQYVTECWRPILTALTRSFPTVESLICFFSQLIPTTSKVVSTIDCQPTNDGERDALKYLKRYIKGLDSKMLATFLRFVTGSDLMLFQSWEINFTQLDGCARRPVAHTCTNTLELPLTYQSFPELREEFNQILKAVNWEMDIV